MHANPLLASLCASGNPSAWVCRQQAARDYCNDKLLRQSLRQWQLSARWSRDSGWKEDLAFRHCSETMLIKAVDSWRLVSNAPPLWRHYCQ